MILVTGAAGITGLAVLRALAARSAAIRAFVSRQASGESVRAAGATEVFVGDLRKPDDLAAAVRGATAVHHICPNVSDAELEIGAWLIAAAKSAGVARFTYHSVIAPQIEAMPHHWDKLRVEALLVESGLEYTILQPAVYMQNLRFQWREVVERGEYPQPCSAAARLGLVDVEDVAAATARVLTEPGWTHATFELCGPEILDRRAMCRVIAAVLGRPVEATVVALPDWRAATEARLGAAATDRLEAMFRYYDRHGLAVGNPVALARILGRPPRSFSTFVARLARGADHQP